MSSNFSLLDLEACLLSTALFSLFALVPGYSIGWLSDLFDFRRRTLAARLAIGVPLSIGLTPLLAYLAGRFLSFTGAWWLFAAIWLAFAVIVVRGFSTARPGGRWGIPSRFVWIACAWVAIGLLSLIDLQIQDRLYFSIVSFDYSMRTPVVASMARTGIPPVNPFFFPGHGIPLRYHYFWLIPSALVKLLGGPLISSRQALIGGTIWCGIGLLAIVPLYLRFFHPAGARAIYRRSWIGIGLLAVTGLDILPNLMCDLVRAPLPDPEWWNTFQVASWTTSVLWVPHHTAALIAGLMGVLIAWNAGPAESPRRLVHMALAGVCLATAIGSSIYVGFVFGIALIAWTGVLFLKRWNREAWFMVGAGCIAILAVVPHLLDLRNTVSGSGGSGGPVLTFGVSDFVAGALLDSWVGKSALRLNLLNLAMLPLNYFLELGVFLVAGIWTLRRWFASGAKFDRYQAATLTFAGAAILVCTFLRSSVIANNDLGWRGFLIVQFVLLLWMVDMLEQWQTLSQTSRSCVKFLIVLGVAGSLNEAVVLRVFPIAADAIEVPRRPWLSLDRQLGSRTYALRKGYAELSAALPPGAIVQHNPNRAPGDLPYGLYADRPAAAEAPNCGSAFGGDPKECAGVLALLNPIFAGSARGDEADRACASLDISAILIKDTDGAWANRAGWIWQRTPIAANRFLRAVPCGTTAASRSAADVRARR